MGEMSERDRYLAELAQRLRLPDALRDEVLEEIAGHLDDATQTYADDGLSRVEAERRAIGLLGPVETLATRFRRTHQTTRRLFAAVGGGMWDAGKDALRGLLAGYLLSLLALMLGSVALEAVARWTGTIDLMGYRTFGTELTGLSFALASAWGAEGLVVSIAARSRRRIEEVRRPVAGVGLAILAVAVSTIDTEHDWLSVLLFGALPLVFAIMAWNTDPGRTPDAPLRGLRPRWLLAAAVAVMAGAVLVAIVTRLVAGPLPVPTESVGEQQYDAAGWTAAGFEVIAPTVMAGASGVLSTTDRTQADGIVVVTLSDYQIDWDGWRDLRVEAWRALPDPWETVRLAPGADTPFVVAAINDPWDQAGTVIGVARVPDVSDYLLVVTGLDPSTGGRVALGWPEGGQTAFHGDLLDWFAAL